MFEDQNKNSEGVQPTGGAEDIFSDTDKAPKAQVAPIGVAKPQASPVASSAQPGPPTALASGKLQPATALTPSVPSSQITSLEKSSTKKFIIIAVVSVVFIIIIGVGYVLFKSSQTPTVEVPELGLPDEPEIDAPVENEPETEPTGSTEEEEGEEDDSDTGGNFFQDFTDKSIEGVLDPIVDPAKTDTDQDGLSDAQEYEINTNPRLVDSDNDGLSDWEEYAIFGTDPVNKDSDSDGYSDGEEVQNGYDPNGSGKLLNFEK